MEKPDKNKVTTHRLTAKSSALVGLVSILAVEFVSRNVFISKGASGFQIGIVLVIEWVVALVLLFYWIPKVEARKLSSIGLGKFRARFIWLSIGSYVLFILLSAGVDFPLKAMGLQTLRDLSQTLDAYDFPLLFGLFLTGTFVEEIFYRGYIIERVAELTGRRWAGGIISWGTFTLVHLSFFGPGPTIEVALFAVILVILYTRTKSLWPAIITHGINDVFGFLIGPFLV